MLNKNCVTDKASQGVKLFNIAKGLENRSKIINSLRYNAKKTESKKFTTNMTPAK